MTFFLRPYISAYSVTIPIIVLIIAEENIKIVRQIGNRKIIAIVV